MKEGFIGEGARKLHYLQWGTGAELLIAFHGYNNSSTLFSSLARMVGNRFTTISLDLPYHGQTEWKGQSPLTKQELCAMLDGLMKQQGVQKISLAAYSLGGRVCLTLLECIPDKIAGVYLMAPDGLVTDKLYWAVTKSMVGKKMFERMVKDPTWHLNVIDWLHKKGWIDNSKQRFVHGYLSSQQSRQFLQNAWIAVQDMIPDRRNVRANIEQFNIPLHLYMGKYDSIIPPKNAFVFAKGVKNIHVHVMEKGHRVIDEETCRIIANLLLQQ